MPIYPLEVYRFLRDEARTSWIQFIPVVERINEKGCTLYQEGTRVSNRSVLPEQLGSFLTCIFDEWVQKRRWKGHSCKLLRPQRAAGWAYLQECAFLRKHAAWGLLLSTMGISTHAIILWSQTTCWAILWKKK